MSTLQPRDDPSPSRAVDPDGVVDQVFKSQIGKIVAFAIAPLLALAVPPVVDALNTALGTDFSNQEISNIAIATVVGVAIVIWQWLRNRGNWERAVAELYTVYEHGRDVVPGKPLPNPVSPPLGAPEDPSTSSALGMKPRDP